MKKTNVQNKKNFNLKIIIFLSVLLVALILIMIITGAISDHSQKAADEEITIDPSKLAETKEEGFDIMEYAGYLNLNRTIMVYESGFGVSYSIDQENYANVGPDIKIVFELIGAIIAGNSNIYNDLINDSSKHYDSFTQQQIYDVEITRESMNQINSDGKIYTEYVLIVEYKIHENNGSFRKDIESDASRPQYFVINNSTGEFKVMNIEYVKYSH